MTNYENYVSKIWDDETEEIPNPIDWSIIKLIRMEMVDISDHPSTYNLRPLSESEFEEQMQNNMMFAEKWTIL